jgi:flagellar motor switch protein FliN/FliY
MAQHPSTRHGLPDKLNNFENSARAHDPVIVEPQFADDQGDEPSTAASTAKTGLAAVERSFVRDEEAELQYLLNQAEEALYSAKYQRADGPSAVAVPYILSDFSAGRLPDAGDGTNLLREVELNLKIELGRTNMHLEDVLKLRRGAIVALDKLADEPVEVYVNGRLIARGEVLVLNDNFCVRVTELVADEGK